VNRPARMPDCIAAAFREANTRWPKRNKRSDGWIGDPRHAARRSDHNPDPATGYVHAFDITHDPANGPDGREFVQAILDRRDPRVTYIIHAGQIWRSYPHTQAKPWHPAPYTGPNPHHTHVHVSIKYTDTARNDTRPWFQEEDMPLSDDDFKKIARHIDAQGELTRTWLSNELTARLGHKDTPIKDHAAMLRDSLASLTREKAAEIIASVETLRQE
jgi:hypothetical protein